MPSVEERTLRYVDFESFYRSQWQEVYRPPAIVLRNPDLARDATNEAMERALRKWNKVKRIGNQTGWVYRVAHNWAIDQIRKKSRLRRLTKAPPELVWLLTSTARTNRRKRFDKSPVSWASISSMHSSIAPSVPVTIQVSGALPSNSRSLETRWSG